MSTRHRQPFRSLTSCPCARRSCPELATQTRNRISDKHALSYACFYTRLVHLRGQYACHIHSPGLGVLGGCLFTVSKGASSAAFLEDTADGVRTTQGHNVLIRKAHLLAEDVAQVFLSQATKSHTTRQYNGDEYGPHTHIYIYIYIHVWFGYLYSHAYLFKIYFWLTYSNIYMCVCVCIHIYIHAHRHVSAYTPT